MLFYRFNRYDYRFSVRLLRPCMINEDSCKQHGFAVRDAQELVNEQVTIP